MSDLSFYVNEYIRLNQLKNENIENTCDDLFITNSFSIADSLSYPLYLSPITITNNENEIFSKYLQVNRFLDIYTNIRMLCNRAITQSSIRNYFYDLIKEIRNLETNELSKILEREIEKLKEIKENTNVFLIDNMGYYHYFYARILYNLPTIRDEFNFGDLLRSRKQNSFILTQIFNSEELEKSVGEFYDPNFIYSIGNYCLIRRYDIEEFSSKQTRFKLSFLNKKGYLPESSNILNKDKQILDFISERNSVLNRMIETIWI